MTVINSLNDFCSDCFVSDVWKLLVNQLWFTNDIQFIRIWKRSRFTIESSHISTDQVNNCKGKNYFGHDLNDGIVRSLYNFTEYIWNMENFWKLNKIKLRKWICDSHQMNAVNKKIPCIQIWKSPAWRYSDKCEIMHCFS